MNEPEKPKKGWAWQIWLAVLVVIGLLFYLAMPNHGRVHRGTYQYKGINNARQIIGLIHVYAADYGTYPDHGLDHSNLTSNRAFRPLFSEGLIMDESIFGCPGSMYAPDKDIGTATEYDQALTAGENHWVLVAGMNTDSPAHYPLLMENAVDATWPPRWLPYVPNKPMKGLAWYDDTIIVGFNDGSVQKVKLVERDGFLHLPKSILEPKGKTPLPVMKILDIIPRGSGPYVNPPGSAPGPPLNAPAGRQ